MRDIVHDPVNEVVHRQLRDRCAQNDIERSVSAVGLPVSAYASRRAVPEVFVDCQLPLTWRCADGLPP